MKQLIILLPILFFTSCIHVDSTQSKHSGNTITSCDSAKDSTEIVNIAEITKDKNSFEYFLHSIPVSPTDSVRLYNGNYIYRSDIDGILATDFGGNSNEQCADAAIYLIAKYLWTQKRYSEIKFHFVNGFLAEYEKWARGYRINANNKTWYRHSDKDYSYKNFKEYLDVVYTYANSFSIYNELQSIPFWRNKLQIGDLFITPGFPGHVAMVYDIRINEHKEQEFRLIQGFMPAQQIELLSEWFTFQECVHALRTPRYFFFNDEKTIVKRWQNL